MKNRGFIFIIVFILVLITAGCHPVQEVPSATELPVLQTAVPTPTLSPTPSPAPTPYSIAWISDTQHYSKLDNGIYECMTGYLSENADNLNLKYIIHTGDLVHLKEKDGQWLVADRAMQIIDHIPNGVCSGNHDVGSLPKEEDYSAFCTYFGAKRYIGKPWYKDNYADNRDHYDLIDIGNTHYVFVYLGNIPHEDDFSWVKNAFLSNPDRIGILCTHEYFDSDLSLTETGQKIYNKLVLQCPNLYMVCCGHKYNCSCVPTTLAEGRTVLQCISNYQAIGNSNENNINGGDGYIRFMEINESEGTIRFYSYSPFTDDYAYFDKPEHLLENHAFIGSKEDDVVPIPW